MSRALVAAFGLLLVSTPGTRAQTSPADMEIPSPPASLSDRLHAIDVRIAHDPDDLGARIARVDILYLMGVDEEACIERGMLTLDDMERRFGDRIARAELGPRVQALRGALITLRAKHAFWPHHKLGHVNEGMTLLDAAVAAQPDAAPVRYLRLMSGFYLPGILGRSDEVAADLQALARLLPHARADFPTDLYPVVLDFVLEHGNLTEAERAALSRLRDGA